MAFSEIFNTFVYIISFVRLFVFVMNFSSEPNLYSAANEMWVPSSYTLYAVERVVTSIDITGVEKCWRSRMENEARVIC